MLRSLPWLVRRLSLMRPSEVGYHAVRGIRKRVARSFARPGRPLSGIQSVTGTEYARPNWYIDLSKRDEMRQYACGTLHWTNHAAELFRQHKFSFFAFKEQDFGDSIRWNYDYRNGMATSLAYGPTLDYRDPRLCGDIKYSWEHNRHHHLVELAKGYYIANDLRFADEVRAQVDSWIDQSPCPFGINWTSALENAIRVINWCFTFRFLEEGGYRFVSEEGEFRRRWIASIREHLQFIASNLSRHSSANNHLIGEASGLFIGALMFRFTESKKWMAIGKEILETEVLNQNWPDGVNKEQSTSYQVFVFDFVMLAVLLARKNDLVFADTVLSRLEAMAEFIAALIGEDGAVPAIGDGDDGHVVRLAYRDDFSAYRSLLATAAAVFGRRDFAERAGSFDEKSFWFLGLEGQEAFQKAERFSPLKRVFPDGGYFIIKDREFTLIFDCGPLGYLSLAAHGHADALSIILEYRGKRFLVDPGTCAYHSNEPWRNYFRGTAAHNTVRIAGTDQSVIGGNFMWLRKARATLLWSKDRGVCGQHDGYCRLTPPAVHEREVTIMDESPVIKITDRIMTHGEYRVEQFFQWDHACICTLEGNGYRIENGGATVRIVPDERTSSRELLLGSELPIGGWFSSSFDRRIPAPTLRFSTTVAGDVVLVTSIHLL